MKRAMKTLVAIVLALACAAALAESDYTYYPESEDYVGDWICGDYVLSIQHAEADKNLFVCTVTHPLDDETVESWVYDGCAYDDIGEALSCEMIGVKTVETHAEEGVKVQQVFDDGAAAFALNDDDFIEWTDFKEAPDVAPLVFEPYAGWDDTFAALYEGTWVCDRATLILESLDDVFYATVIWADSAFEVVYWEYDDLFVDDVAGELNTPETGVKTRVVYDEDGEVVESEELYSDGAAAFRLESDGSLVWVDYKQAPGADEVVFERAEETVLTPEPEDFVEEYFNVIGGIEQGTAGASLKQAEAACDVALFAVDYEMWNPDVDALRANMLAGWESMTDEARAAFDANFMDVVSLIDDCLNDWEAVRGVFEDADVAEEMDAVMYDPLNRLAWQNLCGYTLTLGNSEE